MSLGCNPGVCIVTNLTLRQSFSTLAQMNFGQISLIWELMRLVLFGNQGNIAYKGGHSKEQKWYGPNRSRRYKEAEDIKVARIHRRTIQKRSSSGPR